MQFHPLGNVGWLNAIVTRRDSTTADRVAAALAARLVPRERGSVWEYYLPYGGGYPPWTSGMVQAAGAQALARASKLLRREGLMTRARSVYVAGARHLIPLRQARGSATTASAGWSS